MSRRFVKWKIQIVKVEEYDGIARKYEKIADSGNKIDNGPVYGYVEHPQTGVTDTEILKMESQDATLNINNVIMAILGTNKVEPNV